MQDAPEVGSDIHRDSRGEALGGKTYRHVADADGLHSPTGRISRGPTRVPGATRDRDWRCDILANILMLMSHLRAVDVENLHAIADEVREVISERGHKVETALDLDEAFCATGSVKSELLRSLIADGVRRGASLVGHFFDRPRGAVEITLSTGHVLCVFRLRRAERRSDGTYRIPTNNAAAWGTLDEETLDVLEHWVLGFTVDEAGALDVLFAAEVLGVEGGSPGHLKLGTPIVLGSGTGRSPTRGFKPSEEGLAGFDELDDYLRFGREAG